jgi:Xaa-Pro aminopeptidase
VEADMAGVQTREVLLVRAAERRERLLARLGSGAVLVPAARLRYRNADSEYAFRQDSDFYYLTGFEEPDAVCLLLPEHPEWRYVLFVRPKNREEEIWSGRRAGVEEAARTYGADAAFPIQEIPSRLPELLRDVETLHYAWGRDETLDRELERILAEHRRTRPRRGRGIVVLRDPATVLHEMRLVKDDHELGCMRRAAAASAAGHLRVLREARPGMHEYELEAMLEYEFRMRGARGPAYGTIVGAGANATILHYRQNDASIQERDLVLVDAGAEVELYAADITRTFPAGSAFTPEQRDAYAVVLEAQQRAIDSVRPGAGFQEPHERALDVLCRGIVALGLLEGPPERVHESGDYRKFYMHRTSHWLGLDVHDVGLYEVEGTARRFEPGMVLTVEPGLYIAPDLQDVPPSFLGLGVRIEDDVLVTPQGHEVLTADVPKEIGAIETLRRAATGTGARRT